VIPQKIDPGTVAEPQVANGAGSVWNSAGTYEEKDQTAWAKEELQRIVSAISVEVPGGSARCTGVKDVQGDVGIHMVRGKKRYLFDLHFTVPFEIDLDGEEKVYTGKINVTDFSADDQSDWEANVTWDERPTSSSPAYAKVLAAAGKALDSPKSGTVCAGLADGLHAFIRAFKAR